MEEKTIGQRIRAARKRAGLTQEQLAEKLLIEKSAVSHYENDKREPSLTTLILMSDVLNVSTDYILKGTVHGSLSIQIVY
ncbi:helix-turn-helix domain-containing protein [Butyrivibrio sp. INlla14]|uniref:helix-turn-helix domain-containing protein n=1 Tax=Butyrivibrio sp. INlla14 TaxID=1520808 RepID=UPI000877354D|nr:helix-turn-helix transcriptional regulator [Butyrivibrio sp. INlla14]SCY62767.1 DNA-binding transcriptional regulator, XRE-family HTH domain [Butyrivibrio sp. INlla14]